MFAMTVHVLYCTHRPELRIRPSFDAVTVFVMAIVSLSMTTFINLAAIRKGPNKYHDSVSEYHGDRFDSLSHVVVCFLPGNSLHD